MNILITLLLFFSLPSLYAAVQVGADLVFEEEYAAKLKGKKIGLITNTAAINSQYQTTIQLFKTKAKEAQFTLKALFGPEHGLYGNAYAGTNLSDAKDPDGIPIFSLHGKHRKPTPEMLKDIDLLVFDIQDIGSRSYTYISALFGSMDAAAENNIPVLVLDRPNPINGVVVDGPMVEEAWRSYVGYINIPYCHGMTVGELAALYNSEYGVKCTLDIIPMRGWNRKQTFSETGLPWVATSPNIPEATTPLFYPLTGILGEMHFVNIGIGYTMPFKLVGAPWIDAESFAKTMNDLKLPGVLFKPHYYEPFYGTHEKRLCRGALILVTNPLKFRPVTTQYAMIAVLKKLYPEAFKDAIAAISKRKDFFCKVNGSEQAFKVITEEKNIMWKLRGIDLKKRDQFLTIRKKYLIPGYNK